MVQSFYAGSWQWSTFKNRLCLTLQAVAGAAGIERKQARDEIDDGLAWRCHAASRTSILPVTAAEIRALLFHLISKLYETTSLLVTTNLSIKCRTARRRKSRKTKSRWESEWDRRSHSTQCAHLSKKACERGKMRRCPVSERLSR